MTRTEFQDLAEERAQDAQALLSAGRWSGAYYLAGYSTECGLKACIAKLTNQDDYPDKVFAQSCWTHKLETLVRLAGLESLRAAQASLNPTFGIHWGIAKDWDEESRYKLWTESQARKLFAALTDLTDGVLPWIRGHW